MSFLYPMGLLGLLGIPILIIVYLIKSKYTEQILPSTYLWRLSERFLKKKKRPSPLAGLISLLLQILVVTAISFAIAHPVYTVSDAAREYCFVLDASGSMNMESDGKTRFEKGKDRIAELIEESVDGSVYTLISVGDSSNVLFSRVEEKEEALLLLQEAEPTHTEADTAKALERAQRYFDENPSAKIYFVTDTAYQTHQNVELINVSAKEENLTLDGVAYEIVGDQLHVTGAVIPHGVGKEVVVELYLDGGETAVASANIVVGAHDAAEFSMTCDGVENFSSLKVVLQSEDALALDNESMIFNVKSENTYSTLLVSNDPFLIEQGLRAWKHTQIHVITPAEYEDQSGYGLYIFDSFSPAQMPRDGTVWLINPDGTLTGAGFSVQGEVPIEDGAILELSKSSSTQVKKLTQSLGLNDVYVSEYIKCGIYRNFTTVMSYQGSPVIFAGTNDYGNREVVMAFDLHKSNFTVLPEYLPFVYNLLDYSFPTILEEVSYDCGEELTVNVLPNCESIRMDSPMGEVYYLDASSAVGTIVLNEVGEWRMTMMVGGTPREFSVYASMAPAETEPQTSAEHFSVTGEAQENYRDGIYDVLMIAFICLAILGIADWMVYCYEKYQLR
ncbi:MAG: BatA and WFA domain-containing protein [Clostridia bacterium]|nr:BatA and WFA domain-containing protein [Clostridia bacterium]